MDPHSHLPRHWPPLINRIDHHIITLRAWYTLNGFQINWHAHSHHMSSSIGICYCVCVNVCVCIFSILSNNESKRKHTTFTNNSHLSKFRVKRANCLRTMASPFECKFHFCLPLVNQTFGVIHSQSNNLLTRTNLTSCRSHCALPNAKRKDYIKYWKSEARRPMIYCLIGIGMWRILSSSTKGK